MSNFRARLFEEHTQLIERINKLKAFIVSDQYEALPEIERNALKQQLKFMEGYFDVLSKRCSRLCN
jgi:hypothetical protein